ncbi:MAG TPA: hypothetical protein VGN59_11325 [Acidimicrobiia bacterium]
MTLVGALAGRGRAAVDPRGSIRVVGEPWSLDWWVGADDRWRLPAGEPSVRQHTIDGTPVVETAMRVPGGDAVQRVYGIGGPGGLVIVEVENDSPAAFVVAFAVVGARSVAAAGAVLEVDDRPAVFLPAPPARWAVGTTALDPATVAFETGPFPSRRAGRKELVHAAVLAPLSHRSRLRIALATSGEDPGPVELAQAASPADAAAGWHALLDHGMRAVLPDAKVQADVALARSQILLDPDPGAVTTAALEDWGHDTEAAWAWRGLSFGARRAARRRHGPFDDSTPGGLLESVRRMLVRDDRELELAPGLPGAWHGQDLEVFDAPTRGGRLSYALRWHGDRAALLWEVGDPVDGLVLRAPALDSRWSARDPSGEALLGPVPIPH